MKFLLIAVLALSASAFANEDRDAAVIASTIKAAQALSVADLSCTTVADCKVLALGSRACGGPSDFMIVSKKNPSIRQITSLAKRSERLEDAFNMRYGVISICMIESEPSPVCVANVCQ